MSKHIVPQLERRAICITSDEGDPGLAAVVSSHFNEENSYFAVFKFPPVRHTLNKVPEPTDDGFLSQMRACDIRTLINNALVLSGVELVLLVGLSDIQKTYFDFVPTRMRVTVDDMASANSSLSFLNKRFGGSIECRGDEIGRGLLVAKREKRSLIVNDQAPRLPASSIGDGDGLVVLESKNDVSDIIAINYAHSIGADVKFVKPIQREATRDYQRRIHEWKRRSSREGRRILAREVYSRVGHPNFSKYQFVTFFTEGLPYGAILRNSVPFSHILRSLREDLLIFNSILWEAAADELKVGSAIIFSPELDLGEAARIEAECAIASLAQHGFLVRGFLKDKATVRVLEQFGGHFPYELLHICSHGGETTGQYVFDEFVDRAGVLHTVEYEEVIGYSDYDKEMVQLFKKAIFRKFDGLRWMSPELKQRQYPDYVWDDMFTGVLSNARGNKPRRVKTDYPIQGSCHVQCFDSIHQGQFQILASYGCPIIFNNTCSSWNEIAVQFIAAGCRGYVGTIWNVTNKTALTAARQFYSGLCERDVIDLVFEMNKSISDETDKHIYIYWGLHFISMEKPPATSRQRVPRTLIRSARAMQTYLQQALPQEVKRNAVDILNFIRAELLAEFDPADFSSLSSEEKSVLVEAGCKADSEGAESTDLSTRSMVDLA